MYYVENRKKETLIPLIKAHVPESSIITTDCFRTYNDLDKEYLHLTVDHSKEFVDSETGAHTQNIESLWSRVKKHFKVKNGVKKHKVQELLDLIVFFNIFKEDPFEGFLQIIKIKWNLS